jgi:D-alanyl-D-alanine carboxypeptidase
MADRLAMSVRPRLVALLVAVGLATASGASSAPDGGHASSTPPPVERVAWELAGPGRKGVIVLASIRGQQFVATGGSGRTKADQRFRVGSVTKTFTATLLLQLVDERKLRLDDTLEDHVPRVVPRGDEITVRQLLQHRSGLVDYTDEQPWFQQASRSSSTRPIDILRHVGSKPLRFEPGSRFLYNNTDYIALGLIVEAVTGRSYGDALEQRIFGPLRLEHTELPKTRQLPDLRGEVLRTPYWQWPGDWLNPTMTWATGGIVSNASELARFYSALLSGRLLSKASMAAMKETETDARSVGLGISAWTLPCGRIWQHTGWLVEWMTWASASENGDRVSVVSVRGGAVPPPVERVLLCPRPRPVVSVPRSRSSIAFVSTSGPAFLPGLLEVTSADGGEQGWLTLGAVAGTPDWSPDGRRIAFENNGDGGSEIYVTNAAGSSRSNLTRHPGGDGSPAWSPDGRRIAFVSSRTGSPNIYVMNADGSLQRNLTRTLGQDHHPIWSPDGRSLAFTSQIRPGAQRDIQTMSADGSGRRNLTRNPAHDDAPVWSPDGRMIAFVRDSDVCVMNADGSRQRWLTRGAARDGAPAWSPDGRRLVFERQARHGGRFDLYVVNTDGSGLHRLAEGGQQPRFAPGGRLIAFVRSRDGRGDIYVMHADGSRERNLTRSRANDGWFAWSPVPPS